MPLGGGGVGCNVWVEDGDLLLYFSQSGSFDENNAFLKSGRLRIKLAPNPFTGQKFRQELKLKDGYIRIDAADITIKLWVDVFHPVIHVDIAGKKSMTATAIYENWRLQDRLQKGKENNANSWKWASHVPVITRPDLVAYDDNQVVFYHRNNHPTVFDATVAQQGLDSVKHHLFNPLENLTSGGLMRGEHFISAKTVEGTYLSTRYKGWPLVSRRPAKKHALEIFLYQQQAKDIDAWKQQIGRLIQDYKPSHANTINWWHKFWKRSFVFINPKKNESDTAWQLGRNYQLFRYMLGCNAYGAYPTKFNGGLFTFDPELTDSTIKGTPDHRNWGGGTFTAQNQRLVYWPMLKSGDADMMTPQFDFYNRILPTALLRTKTYWGHGGANFNEQIENFGLPNPTEYSWKRPSFFDPGVEYNAWLEYEWDTVLEFCMMIMEAHAYAGKDISAYMPLIKNALVFFDEHYQYLAKRRGSKALDGNGHLVLYPGSAAETFKMAYNASSTIAALQAVTDKLLQLPEDYLSPEERMYFEGFLNRVPPIPLMSYDGDTTIAPAKIWARVNNVETPQLYPVFPWKQYGLRKPGLNIARNTYFKDSFALKFRSHVGWKQDLIFAARLGLTDEAKKLALLKMKDSGRRFPAFWGPGFDWVPDHNWGGSGMIGIQEMLLQADGNKLLLLPAWPKEWNVHFKLHAPQQTTVEAALKNGKLTLLNVWPEARKKDIILPKEFTY